MPVLRFKEPMIQRFIFTTALAVAGLSIPNLSAQNPAAQPAPAAAAPVTPPPPVSVKIDAGRGVLVEGQPAIVKLSFTNNTNSRKQIDSALCNGTGLSLGTLAGPLNAGAAATAAPEPAYEIPPGGTLTCSVNIAPLLKDAIKSGDSASLQFAGGGMSSTPVSVELVEDFGRQVAVFHTNMGVMKFKVDTVNAPLAARNFMRHVKAGTYTGTSFHRVLKTFMAQGGDPNSKDADPGNDGQGGAAYNNKPLPAEITDVKHGRGTLSMARNGDPMAGTHGQAIQMLRMLYSKMSTDPMFAQRQLEQLQRDGFFRDRQPFLDSAGSQFFICFGPTPQLDGGYTAFGQLVEGDDVLDKIKAVGADSDSDNRGRPKQEIKVESATIEILK